MSYLSFVSMALTARISDTCNRMHHTTPMGRFSEVKRTVKGMSKNGGYMAVSACNNNECMDDQEFSH